MLPTALPYHTPAKLSRAFFVRRHTAGRQQQGSSPTPRPPQGGSATSGVWRQGNPAVYRHPKNCTATLDNNKRLWYSIGATDGVWRESVRTSKRANPQGLALFLFPVKWRRLPARLAHAARSHGPCVHAPDSSPVWAMLWRRRHTAPPVRRPVGSSGRLLDAHRPGRPHRPAPAQDSPERVRAAPLRNTFGCIWRTAEMLHPPNPPLLCARACSGPARGHSTALHPALSLWAGHRPRRPPLAQAFYAIVGQPRPRPIGWRRGEAPYHTGTAHVKAKASARPLIPGAGRP